MSLIRFPLDEIVGDGIVRESEFRARLKAVELEPYRDQAVLIPWLHGTEMPLWVYLMTVARLAPIAAVLSFGEACSPVVLTQIARPGVQKITK